MLNPKIESYKSDLIGAATVKDEMLLRLGWICAQSILASSLPTPLMGSKLNEEDPRKSRAATRESGLRPLNAHPVLVRLVGGTAACGRDAHHGLVLTLTFVAYHPPSAWALLDPLCVAHLAVYAVFDASRDYRRLVAEFACAGLFEKKGRGALLVLATREQRPLPALRRGTSVDCTEVSITHGIRAKLRDAILSDYKQTLKQNHHVLDELRE
uniref:Uncharacterized protein n=1 Tax=Ananas comosus var. bracteatus TaxID=296719 RepID=A0A6V7QAI1_ANACO|nr:unnamed protein product [Ananas comosus var. bracteatus]